MKVLITWQEMPDNTIGNREESLLEDSFEDGNEDEWAGVKERDSKHTVVDDEEDDDDDSSWLGCV